MELGNISEIVAAATAIAALIAAIFAAKYTKGQLENSERQLNQALAREEQEQASHISAWVRSENWETKVVVQNSSVSPVYNVDLSVNVREWDNYNKRATFYESILKVAVLPPGRYIFENYSKNEWSTAVDYEDGKYGTPVLSSQSWKVNKITYRDSKNKIWIRDDSGLQQGKE